MRGRLYVLVDLRRRGRRCVESVEGLPEAPDQTFVAPVQLPLHSIPLNGGEGERGPHRDLKEASSNAPGLFAD